MAAVAVSQRFRASNIGRVDVNYTLFVGASTTNRVSLTMTRRF